MKIFIKPTQAATQPGSCVPETNNYYLQNRTRSVFYLWEYVFISSSIKTE